MADNVKVVICGQVNGGSLHPLGEATVEQGSAESTVAALFRSMSAEFGTDAAFLETWMRYDGEGE
jgi:hypothetical protein